MRRQDRTRIRGRQATGPVRDGGEGVWRSSSATGRSAIYSTTPPRRFQTSRRSRRSGKAGRRCVSTSPNSSLRRSSAPIACSPTGPEVRPRAERRRLLKDRDRGLAGVPGNSTNTWDSQGKQAAPSIPTNQDGPVQWLTQPRNHARRLLSSRSALNQNLNFSFCVASSTISTTPSTFRSAGSSAPMSMRRRTRFG